MGGRPAARGENAGNPRRIEARDVRGPHFIHHQDVRFLRFFRSGNCAQLSEDPTADIAQIRRALGQQGIVQGFLLSRGSFDHRHPGRCRAFALLEAVVDIIGQRRIVEHLQVRDENLADRLGLAALDQAVDIVAHIDQRLLQACTLGCRRLTAQGVINVAQGMNMRWPRSNTRCRGDTLDHCPGNRCLHGWQRRHNLFDHRDGQWQRLDLLTQPLPDSRQQSRQGVSGNTRLGDKLQDLAATSAEPEQLAQALGRYWVVGAIDDAQANFAFELLGQLRQDFRRAGMQAMGVGQADTGARPIGRDVAPQHLEHRAGIGGPAQFMPTALDQQRTQALEQGLVRLAQAGQAKQAIERLAQVTQGFVRGDKCQPRALDRLFAVQPPQPITQRQRLDLLQHGGKPIADALGLAQQARTAPGQFFEIIGHHAQADHLGIQCQLLGGALQQLQQGLGGAGLAQGFTQVGFTQGPGQQLQQTQVFIGFGGNTNGQVHLLAIAPIHPLGELHQAHASGKNQVAGLRGAMGDRNTLAEKGRALRFPRLEACQIPLGNQAVGYQVVGQQLQCGRFVLRLLAHGYLL
ncbi:hypothetical protein D3C76_762500 [compost metagenome]